LAESPPVLALARSHGRMSLASARGQSVVVAFAGDWESV